MTGTKTQTLTTLYITRAQSCCTIHCALSTAPKDVMLFEEAGLKWFQVQLDVDLVLSYHLLEIRCDTEVYIY